MKNKILTTISTTLLIVASGSGPVSNAGGLSEVMPAPIQLQHATRFDRAALRAAPRAKLLGTASKPKRAHFTPEPGLSAERDYLYIVELADAPVATYRGGVAGLTATSIEAVAPDTRSEANRTAHGILDARSPVSQSYARFLESKQGEFKRSLDRAINRTAAQPYAYRYGFNGIAVRLTQPEATRVASMPGVRAVTRDRLDKLDTSRTPTFIGAPGIWDGTATGVAGKKGEGMLVGVLDTGINQGHPSFATTGQDGYTHTNPFGSGVYLGECNDFPGMCNEKLVGSYYYLEAWGGRDPLTPPGDPISKDTDGHGSHTASTAAGNVVIDPPFLDPFGNDTGVTLGTISGVAPHANIIAYKVCAPSCGAADRVAAVDQAILDGVDAINHSIGTGGGSPWYEPVAVAFKNARAAGIMVQNSAGNNGPGAGTAAIGGNGPWVTGVAASTHDRAIPPKLLTGFTGGSAPPPPEMSGLSFSGGYTGPIVWAGDYSNGDPTPEQCMVPFRAGTFTDEIVICERGTIARVEKCLNVAAGGAKGCVLVNVDGGATDLAADPFVIPGIHIDADDGNTLKAWVAQGSGHHATITASDSPAIDPSAGDHLADFSSRGPYTGFDFIAPSISAPGVDVFAAGADLEIENPDASVAGAYGAISGTSMASPHATGSATLLKQVHPDWTPAEVLSAMATTGTTAMVKEDGVTPADAFDYGGGRVQLVQAVNAGLLLDEVDASFSAANPDVGGDPRTLNVPYLVDDGCLQSCSWQRTLEATVGGTWEASATSRDERVTIDVEPASFTLAAGETQTITVTAHVAELPLDTWGFGEVWLTPGGGRANGVRAVATPPTVMQVVVKPTNGIIPEAVTINAARDVGSQLVGGFRGIEITDLQAQAFGLAKGQERQVTIFGEYPHFDPYADVATATEFYDLPAGTARFIVATSSTAIDVDLFVGRDDNGDHEISPDEERCNSGSSGANELCEINSPEAGSWWVTVLQFDATGESDTTTINATILSATTGNLQVTGPGSVPAGEPWSIRVQWNEDAMTEGETWYGAVQLGTDAANPANIGFVPINILRTADDVEFTADADAAAPGDTLTFTVKVNANFGLEDLHYSLDAAIPSGFTLVPGSITGGGTPAGNGVHWEVTQPSLAALPREYFMTTNRIDASCDTGFGGYVDLASLEIFPDPGISGDNAAWSAFDGQNINFYGQRRASINFTDDGFAFFASSPGDDPGLNRPIPSSADPNDMAAVFWNDWFISYDESLNRGVSLATAGTDVSVIEYDDAEPAPEGATNARYDFEVVFSGVVDDSPGAYEVVMAYDNLITARTTHGITAGVENVGGTAGTQYAYNDMTKFSNDLIVCYDYHAPAIDPTVLSYQVTVDAGAPGGERTSTLTNVVDNPGSEAVTNEVVVHVNAPADADADGVSDDVDNCTAVANADQRDTDGDGYGNRCDSDFTQDGVVNWLDLGYLRTHFFTSDPNADLDGDGYVNYTDLSIMKSQLYAPPGPSALAGGG